MGRGVEALEDRSLLSAFSASGSTLNIDLAANETLQIVSAGSTYTLTSSGSWSGTTSANVTTSGSVLTVTAAGLTAFNQINVTDSGAGAAVTFNNSGANAYGDSINITLDNATPGAVTFNGTSTFSGSAALAATASSISVSASASLAASSGSVSLTASKNIALASGSSVATVDGNLTVEANQQVTPTTGSFVGVDVNNGLIKATGTGSVTVRGKGGTSSGAQIGVRVQGGGDIIGGTSGTLTVQGTGGATGTTNYGVQVTGSGSTITSNGSHVSVNGTGGGTDASGAGVSLESSGVITAGGVGNVTVVGQGSTAGTGSDNYGVLVGSTITSNGGNVSVTGTAGGTGSSSGNNFGVLVSGGQVTSGGSGTVTVFGQGGAGTAGNNNGVRVGSTITSGGGNVTVTGTVVSGTGGTPLEARSGSLITTATNGGSITLIGDTLSFESTATISASSSSSVALRPFTNGVAMSLSDANLDRITAGTINIGDTNTGTITLSDAITRAALTNFSLTNDSTSKNIDFGSGSLNANGGNVTLNTRGITTDASGTDIVANHLSLTARAAGIGSASNPLRIDATSLTSNTGSGNGSQFLRETNTVLVNSGWDADGGNITLFGGTFQFNAANPLRANTLTVKNGELDLNNFSDDGTGSLALESGATYATKIRGNTGAGTANGHDQLAITGSVTLGGAILSLNTTGLTSSELTAGQTFVLIANDGTDAVSGTFNGLAEGATVLSDVAGSGLNLKISYVGGTGNDVVLTAGELVAAQTLSASLVNGDLVIEDTDATGKANSLTLSRSGANLVVSDLNEGFLTSAISGAVLSSGNRTITIPASAIGSGKKIIVKGQGGSDSLSVDVATDLGFNVEYQGGTGTSDSLTLLADTVTSVTHAFTNANDGSITIVDIGTRTISYTGLEPITDNLTATDRVFTFNSGAETITVTDGTASDGKTTIDSTLSESVTFVNPTASLTINAGTGNDTVTITSVDAGLNAALTIDGDTDTDTVNLNGDITLGSGRNLIVNAESFSTGANADLTTSGTGNITFTADTVALNSSSTLVSSGTITLQPQTSGRAIDLGTETSGQLSLTDAELDRLTAGTLSVGNANSGAITVSAALTPISSLSLTTSAGVAVNQPVTMAADKNLSVTSSSTTTTISLPNATSDIAASGSGSVTLTTARSISMSNGSSITTVNGGASLTAARTIVLSSGSSITSANGGVTLSGNQQATATTGNFDGVNIAAATIETTGSGAITLSGRGGIDAATPGHDGIALDGSIVRALGTGTISLTGVGGSGTGSNYGVAFLSASSVSTVSGGLTINGTGGDGTSNDSHGVSLQEDSIAQVTTGRLTVTGTAAQGSSRAVRLSDSSGGRLLSVGSGEIVITATAPGATNEFLAGADSILGGPTATGPITINANTVGLVGTTVVRSTGALTIQPRAAATTIGIGGGTGTLNLADSELGLLSDGFSAITIGSATSGTGAVDVDSSTFKDNVTVVGGSVSVTELNAGTNNVTLTARSGAISDGGDVGTDITGGTVSLTATTGIGASGDSVSLAATSLSTNTSSANAAQYLSEFDSVAITKGDAGTGTITLSGGEFDMTSSPFGTNTKVVVASGATLDVNGQTDTLNSATVSGGTLKGAGNLKAAVSMTSGSLTPGDSVGILATKNLSLTGGDFFVSLAGNGGAGNSNGHDQLNVEGTVKLGGTLKIDTAGLLDAEAPGGQSFTILNNDGADALSGTFSGLAEGAVVASNLIGTGRELKISYVGGTGNDVVLTVSTVAPPPSLSASIVNGDLVIEDTDTNGKANQLTLSRSGENLVISDPNEQFATSAISGAVLSNGNKSITIPASAITAGKKIVIKGQGGSDSLSVNVSTDLGFDVEFQGGTGTSDSLTLLADTVTSVTHAFTNANDGSITIVDGSTRTISYTGLEPITDNLTATDRVFTFNGGAETITVTDGTASDGKTTIDSTLSESVTFVNPTGSLTINAGTGNDTVTISSVDAGLNAALTINGDADFDSVLLLGDITLASGKNLLVNAESVSTGANADLITSGSGVITITADDVDLASSSTLVTASTSRITIKPQTAGRAIDLGTNTNGRLSLTDPELDTFTVGVLQIGDVTSGAITLTADIGPARSDELLLQTSSTVTGTAGGVVVGSLAINSGSSVLLTDSSTNVLNRVAANVANGSFTLNETDGLTIGTVAGLNGLRTSGGNVAITTPGAITNSQAINTSTSGFGSPTVQVDFGPSTAHGQSGFTALGPTGGTANGVTVAVSSGMDSRERGALNSGDGLGNLGRDHIFKTDFTVTLTGVAAGIYKFTGYHHDSNSQFFAVTTTFDVNGGTFDSLTGYTATPTTGPNDNVLTAPAALGSGSFNFTSDGVNPVTIRFVGAGGANALLNGFTLTPSAVGNVTLTGGNGSTLSSIDAGTGTLTFSGGEFTLGNNAINDTTKLVVVSTGMLNVNGATDTLNQITVSGGTLKGAGTLTASVSMTSGSIAPGTSTPGIINTGNLTVSAGTFNADIVGNGGAGLSNGHDQLNVAGTVSLSGLALSLNTAGLTAAAVSAGQTFVLINNDGTDAVTGTFSGIAEGATVVSNVAGSGRDVTISYVGGSGNDVVLTVIALVSPTTEIKLVGSDLVIDDIAGGNSNDQLVLTVASGNLIVSDSAAGVAIDATGTLNNAVGDLTGSVTIPLSSFSGNVIVNSLAGNDSITINGLNLGGNRGLAINGGDGTDSISFTTNATTLSGSGTLTVSTETTTVSAALALGGGAATLTTDNIALSANLSGTGALVLKSATTARSIGVGASAIGDFNLDSSELGRLQNGFSSITIGDATNGTGAVDVNASTFLDPVTIVGGSIAVTELNAGTNAVTLTARTGAITDGGDDGTDVTGNAVTIHAVNSTIGAANDVLSLAATSLTTVTANGGQFLSEADSVTLTSINAGTGTVTLSGGEFVLGNNSVNDATKINVAGGTLNLNGTTDTLGLVTASGGTVTGAGTLTSAVSVSAGTISPGSGIGGIGVTNTRDLALTGGSFDFELAGNGGAGTSNGHDQIKVTGTVRLENVSLSRATIDLTADEAALLSTIVLIDNDGTDKVTGTFSGLPEGATVLSDLFGVNLAISYVGGDGNDVVLSVPKFDFGDAPDTEAGTSNGNYETLGVNNGPKHDLSWTRTTLFLGARVDPEAEATPNSDASGDDLTVDDEDGLINPQDLILTPGPKPVVRLRATNTTVFDASLYGWIDYNRNGIFENATERAEAIVRSGTTNGEIQLTFPAFASQSAGTTYARFRLATSSPLFPSSSDGEVEDYPVTILPPLTTLDYGDAGIHGYATDPFSNGPSHNIVATQNTLFLGGGVDAEMIVTTNDSATGDDSAGIDDEDGVIDSELVFAPGGLPVVQLRATNLTGKSANLYGWIDINSDGIFAPAEMAYTKVEQGANQVVTLRFPKVADFRGQITSIPTGSTGARFRLSTDSSLSTPTGYAADGEVEDYRVTISNAVPKLSLSQAGQAAGGVPTVSENVGTFQLEARLSYAVDYDVDSYLTITTDATYPTDFTVPDFYAINSSIFAVPFRIPAGSLSTIIPVTIVRDGIAEPEESIVFSRLGSPTDLVDWSSAYLRLKIQDGDSPIFSWTGDLVRTIDESTSSVQLTATLSKAVPQQLVVPLFLGGTATGTDYTAPATIVFAPNTTTASETIAINNDTETERDETILVSLANTSTTGIGFAGSNSQVRININANDTVYSVSFASASTTATEPQFYLQPGPSIPVTLSPAAPTPLTLFVKRTGSDPRVSASSVLTFQPGQTTAHIDVGILDLNQQTATTDFSLTLDNYLYLPNRSRTTLPVNIVGSNSHRLTVLQDTPRISFGSDKAFYYEGQTGTVDVRLSAAIDRDVKVRLNAFPALRQGATLGQDYTLTVVGPATFADGVLTIPAGQSSATIQINAINDGLAENFLDLNNVLSNVESFGLALASPEGASLGATTEFRAEIGDNQLSVLFESATAGGKRLDQSSQSGDGAFLLDVPENSGVVNLTARVGVPAATSDITVRLQYSQPAVTTTETVIEPVYKEFVYTPGISIKDNIIYYDGNGNIVNRSIHNFIPGALYKFQIGTRSVERTIEVGRATVGVDYETPPATLVIPAGSNQGTISIRLINDNIQEFHEKLIVTMVSASDASGRAVTIGRTPSYSIIIGPDSDDTQQQVRAGNAYLSDSTIFFDANRNGLLDFVDANFNGTQDEGELAEPFVVTGADGGAPLVVGQEFDVDQNGIIDHVDGLVVVSGGIDTATNLPLPYPLTGYFETPVISPLTTVLTGLVEHHGFTVGDAADRVATAFGLPNTRFTSLDPLQGVREADVDAPLIFVTRSMLNGTLTQIASTIAGSTDGPPASIVANALIREFAEQLSLGAFPLDLTSAGNIEALLRGTLFRTGTSLTDEIIAGVVQIITASNQSLASIPIPNVEELLTENGPDISFLEASEAFLEQVARSKTVAQGQVADALSAVAAGTLPINDALSKNTGAALESQVENAQIGVLLPPSLSVSNAELQEGQAGRSRLIFTVSISDTPQQPVAVSFATIDDSATAGEDYDATAGTLVWAAGDSAPKSIVLEINGDTTFEPNERLALLLSNPVNALLLKSVGVGEIINDDGLSVFVPAASGEEGTGSQQTTLRLTGEQLVLQTSGETIVEQPATSTAPITITGTHSADDTLVIDMTSGSPIPADGLIFHGGAGAVDTAEIIGGTFDSITQTLTNGTDGVTQFMPTGASTPQSFQWFGLEPFLLNVGSVSDLVFNLPNGGATAILEDADPTDANPALAGMMQLRSPDGLFETTTFVVPTGSLTINGGDGNDTLTIASLDPTFTATLNVSSLTTTDALDLDVATTLNVSGDLVFAAAGDFTVALSGTTPITQHTQLNVTGTVNLNSATLAITLGYTPANGDSFVIVNNDGTDAITGTFRVGGNSIADGGSFLVSGTTFVIDDTSGSDGNDVTLIVANPTLTATIVGNDLVIEDIDGSGKNNLLSVSRSGADLVISDTNEPFGTAISGAVLSNVNKTVTIPASALGVGGKIIVKGQGGSDSLNVDVSTDLGFDVEFQGGSGTSDSLTLAADTVTSVTHTFTNANDGSVTIVDGGSRVISYTGLEPITDNLSATDRVFTFNGGAETITVTTGTTLHNMIDSDLGESVEFNNPSGSLTINAGDGNDTVTLSSIHGSFGASLTINAGTGDDVVNLNADITFAADKNLDVDLRNDDATPGIDTINVGAGANLVLSGTGAATLRTSRNILVNTGASLSVVNGNLTLDADQGTGVSGNFSGILVTGSGTILETTGTGDISLTGRGGDDAATASHRGVAIVASAAVRSTSSAAGAGGIMLTGTGGLGTNNNIGVSIETGGTSIESAGGVISMTGQGSTTATSVNNLGVLLSGNSSFSSRVTATGSAAISIVGTGGSGSIGNNGVGISNCNVSAVNGNIDITGTATDSTGTGNHGVRAPSRSTITTTGSSQLSITGTAGSTDPTVGFGIELGAGSIATLTLSGATNTFVADSMSINTTNATINAGSNAVVLKPKTTTGAVGIDLGGADSTTNVGLSDAELDRITAGTIHLGDANSGAITFSADITRAANTNINLTTSANNNIAFGTFSLNAGSGGDVSLTTSGTGAITTADNTGTDITGDDISLTAGSNGIGSTTNFLRLAATTITATTSGNGSINLAEADSVTISDNDLNAGTATITLGGGTFLTTATGSILSPVVLANGATLRRAEAGPGILNLADVTLVSGSNLNIEILGTTVGTQYDQLNVTGTVTINDANLVVTLGGGFTPANGDSFVIINNDSTDPVTLTAPFQVGGTPIPDGGSFLVNGTRFVIDYTSGSDNNDVTLIVDTAGPEFTSSDTASVNENSTSVLTVTATDPSSPITFSIDSLTGGADRAQFHITPGGVLTFVSAPNFESPTDHGTNNIYNLTVTATDNVGNTNTQAITVTVTNVNEPPTITSGAGSKNVSENSTAVTTISATDPDASTTLTYSLSGPDAAKFDISDSGVITFKTAPNFEVDPTSYTFDVSVSDGALSDTETVNVTVTDENDPPTIDSGAGSVNVPENSTAVTTISASDPDVSTTLTYSLSGIDAAKFDISTSGVITFKSAPNFEVDPTSYTFDVTVSDGALSDTETVNVTVTNVNEAPTLANTLADQNGTEDVLFSFTIPADTFADVDAGDSVTYSASGTPNWLSFDAATRTFFGTPTNDNVGRVTITVTVKDSANAEVSESFDIVVANTNDAPTLANAIADQSATEGTAFSFQFAADTFADVDAGDTLRYSTSGLPSWLSFNASTRTFSGTPTNAHLGSVSIAVIATDSANATVTETFDIAVIGMQVVSSSGVVTITDVGSASNDTVGITIDGDNLVVTLDGVTTEIPLPGLTGLVINGGGGNDTLNLDLGGGPLPFNIVFNGGTGGFDSLNVTRFDESGELTAFTANYSNRNDGNIEFRDGTSIVSILTYNGLEPITIDGTPDEIIFNLPSTNDTDVRLLDIGGADGLMRLTGSTFETTDFSIAAATSIIINANAGNDRVAIQSVDTSFSGQLIVNGGAGNDTLIGSAYAESFNGGAGNDSILAGNGNDTLRGDAGNDRLDGQGGIDRIVELANSNLTLVNVKLTGTGNDSLTSIERAELTGGVGNNVLDASGFTLGPVSLHGSDGNDTLIGTSFDDTFDGGAGFDTLRQRSSNHQTLTGTTSNANLTGAGEDSLMSIEAAFLTILGSFARTLDASGFQGVVTLEGGSGHDTLRSSAGGGMLNGHKGNDSLVGGNGSDSLLGGAGNDTLKGNDGNDVLRGHAGNDRLTGGQGDDNLSGDAGADKLFGGAGNDLLNGGDGNDTLTGETGSDIINGGADSDAIHGGDGDDLLNGGSGNDTILGGNGSDRITAGGGNDKLSGGTGDDRIQASGATISTGPGDDTIIGSKNRIDEAFTFDFDRLLI